jgi:DNA-binding transcriptional LysR family regulator
MKKTLPPLTWFRAFDASARHLSFTIAAKELGLTQSAVSQHIRALETRLGAQLFVRKPKGLSLTDAGRLLVPDVAAAMVRLTAATDAFLPPDTPKGLSVATSVSIAQWVIAPGLSEYQARCPDVQLRVMTTIWPDDFSAAAADVEIRFGAFDVVGKNAKRLGDQRVVFVAAPGLLDQAPWHRLPLIEPVGVSDQWSQVLAREGIKDRGAPMVYVDTHGLAVDMAISGGGVALTNTLIAGPALRDGRLIALDFPTYPAKEAYFIASNQSAASLDFVDWIESRV